LVPELDVVSCFDCDHRIIKVLDALKRPGNDVGTAPANAGI